MWWGEFYAALTVCTVFAVYLAHRSDVLLAYAGLVLWLGAANFMNVPNVVDLQAAFAVDIFLALAFLIALSFKWSNLLAFMFVLAALSGLWAVTAPLGVFKEGEGALYFLGLVGVWVSALKTYKLSRSSYS